MNLTNLNLKFDYNSPVIISYLGLSLIAWLFNTITNGKSNKLLFSNYRSSPFNPFTYIRLFTHSIGHKDWNHLVSNFLYILLIGPIIEEKYGSINLLCILLCTSLVIAVINIIFHNYCITGASGNVYMLIVLSSFSNLSEGKIPITLVLIFLFYITTEIKDTVIEGNKKVYHDGHLIGALCGLIFGFLFLKYPQGIFSIIPK